MSANTLTIEAANAAGLVTVGPEKGSHSRRYIGFLYPDRFKRPWRG